MSHLIRQMGHVVLESPDPRAAAEDLAQILNVQVTESTDEMATVSSNARSHEVAFLRGASNGVLACGLEAMDADALAEARKRIEAEGLEILDDRPLVPGAERAFRFVSAFGPIFEVHTPVPRRKDFSNLGRGAPTRIDHVNLRASDVVGMYKFLANALGMQLSDRTGEMERAWMRAWDGFHHTVAIGPGAGLHHYGFAAHSFESLMQMADRLSQAGRTMLWGPGRHGPGDNVFAYYLDRDGRVVENSWAMERIENDATYEPRVWDMRNNKRVLNLWGPLPPQSYIDTVTPFIRERT